MWQTKIDHRLYDKLNMSAIVSTNADNVVHWIWSSRNVKLLNVIEGDLKVSTVEIEVISSRAIEV